MQSLVLNSPRGSIAEPLRIDKIRFKNASQHFAGAPVHFGYAGMIINVLIQKFPQRAIRFG